MWAEAAYVAATGPDAILAKKSPHIPLDEGAGLGVLESRGDAPSRASNASIHIPCGQPCGHRCGDDAASLAAQALQWVWREIDHEKRL